MTHDQALLMEHQCVRTTCQRIYRNAAFANVKDASRVEQSIFGTATR